MRPAIPVKHDDLANYLGCVSTPFMWVAAPGMFADESCALLHEVMRDPAIRGPSLADPYPRHLAAGPEELRAMLVGPEVEALVRAYLAWLDDVGATPVSSDDFEELRTLTSSADARQLLVRARFAHAVQLHAAYGRPSTCLSDREVFRYLAWTGAVPLEDGNPDEPKKGGIVSKLTHYRMAAERARGMKDGK